MRGPLLRPALAALALAAALPAAGLDKRPLAPLARVWYVDNTAGADGDGSMVAPFDRLSRAERAADLGDTIYVFRGDGTSKGLDDGIRLRPYRRRVGSGSALTDDGEPAFPAGEPPTLGGRTGPAVILADHVSVEGFAITAGTAPALIGDGVSDVHLVALHVDGTVALRSLRGDARLDSVDVSAKQSPALIVESSHRTPVA